MSINNNENSNNWFWVTSKFYWTGTFANRESGNNETQVYISLCFSWYFTILAFQLPHWPLLKLSLLILCPLLKLYHVWRVLQLSPWSYSLFFFIDIHTLFSVPVDDLSQYFNCHLSAVDSNFHLQPIPISSTSASHFQLIIWYPLWCLIGMSDLCLNQNTWYLLQICSSVTCPHL